MEQKALVVIPDFLTDDLEPENRILGDLARIVALDRYHEDELIGQIEDADAILLYHHISLTRRTLERLRRCRLIVRCGVGYDNVDHPFAASRGIAVANVPDYGSEDVADSAIGMMLSLTRGVHYLNSRLRDKLGSWHYSQVIPLKRLRGQVLAIIGLGRIGTAAALRGKALGMDVLFYDPYKPDGYDKAVGIRRTETLKESLEQAHVVSLHCPLTPTTRRLMNETTIAQMPVGSYLINTARGEVVDTQIIPDAIASGRLAGAGIDVLEAEPARDEDPLIRAWRDPNHPAYHRLIVNPHTAFYSERGLVEMREKGCENVRRLLLGQPVRNVVNGIGPREYA